MTQFSDESYDTVAETFDTWQGDYGDQKKIKFLYPYVIAKLAGLRETAATVLDIGCGNGAFGRFSAAHNVRVDGLDRSGQLIARAEARDRRLGMQLNYFSADVNVSDCADIFSHYSIFTALFSLQDIAFPATMLTNLVRFSKKPMALVILGETYHALTSSTSKHSITRRLHAATGAENYLMVSRADWGGGQESITYCRPDDAYLHMLERLGLSILFDEHVGYGESVPRFSGRPGTERPFHMLVARGF